MQIEKRESYTFKKTIKNKTYSKNQKNKKKRKNKITILLHLNSNLKIFILQRFWKIIFESKSFTFFTIFGALFFLEIIISFVSLITFDDIIII